MKKTCFLIFFCTSLFQFSFGQAVEILSFKDSIYFEKNKEITSNVRFKASGFDSKLKILIRLIKLDKTTLEEKVIKSLATQDLVLTGNDSGFIPVNFSFGEDEITGSYSFDAQYSIDEGKTFTKISYKNPLEIKVLKKVNLALGDISRVFIGGSFDFFEKLTIKDLAGSIEIFSPQALGKNNGISFKVYSTRTFSKPAENRERITTNIIPDFTTLFPRADSILLKKYVLNYSESSVIDNWGLKIGYMYTVKEVGDGKKGFYASLGVSVEIINRTITFSREFDTLAVSEMKILSPDTLRLPNTPKKISVKQFEYYVGVDIMLRYYVSKSFDLRLIGTPGLVVNDYSGGKLNYFSNIGFDLQEKATGLNVSLGGEVRLQENSTNSNFYTLYLGTSFSFEKLKGLFNAQN